MLLDYFLHLRQHQLNIGLQEYIDFLKALEGGLHDYNVDDFYRLSKLLLVKHEKYYDKFDLAFSRFINNSVLEDASAPRKIPKQWLEKQLERFLSPEEMAKIKSLGGFDALMKALKERLKEQKERHQGGNKWIGTAGTSPFGAYGYNPEGIRIGQQGSRHRRAVKVWDKREFINLDEDKALAPRNIKVALKHLRNMTRTGALDCFDLAETIACTAKNAGMLDIIMKPSLTNDVKLIVLFDVGGSMDDHIQLCQDFFTAARNEFMHLDYFYFHNFVYEALWQDNRRRETGKIPLEAILNRFNEDHKLIIVGDASMSPYEILYPGGSVEHMNSEPGINTTRRLLAKFPKAVWLNPMHEAYWEHTQSIQIIQNMMQGRMHALTVEGIRRAMLQLSK